MRRGTKTAKIITLMTIPPRWINNDPMLRKVTWAAEDMVAVGKEIWVGDVFLLPPPYFAGHNFGSSAGLETGRIT
jgi:hypothetical protein